MREVICLSVVLLGLAGREQHTKSYIPTVAVAAAAAEVQPLVLEPIDLQLEPLATCKNGQCGSSKPRATIKRSTRRPRRVFRLFRGRRR